MSTRQQSSSSPAWYLYILRCTDGSLYTGITTDVKRRFAEHCDGKIGAKYTRSHVPVKIVFRKKIADSRGEALKMERRVKKMSKAQKEMLLNKMRALPEQRVKVKKIY